MHMTICGPQQQEPYQKKCAIYLAAKIRLTNEFQESMINCTVTLHNCEELANKVGNKRDKKIKWESAWVERNLKDQVANGLHKRF